MLARVVAVADVIDVQETGTVTVDLLEGFLDKLETFVVELASDCHQELINAECAVAIGIKSSEECRNVLFGNSCFEITTCFRKFLL